MKATTHTVSSALAWLHTYDPKRAKSYDPSDDTVVCWRKKWHRRANGTIIGLNSHGNGFEWEPYRRDIVKYVEYAAPRREAAIERARAACESELQEFRAAVAEARHKVSLIIKARKVALRDPEFAEDLDYTLNLFRESFWEAAKRAKWAARSYRSATWELSKLER